jgi:hypothetical protein
MKCCQFVFTHPGNSELNYNSIYCSLLQITASASESRARITENTSRVCYPASPLVRWLKLQKTDVTWSLSSHSIGALAGLTEHTSRDRYPLMCDVTAYAEMCLPSHCLETGCIILLFYCCVCVSSSSGCFVWLNRSRMEQILTGIHFSSGESNCTETALNVAYNS